LISDFTGLRLVSALNLVLSGTKILQMRSWDKCFALVTLLIERPSSGRPVPSVSHRLGPQLRPCVRYQIPQWSLSGSVCALSFDCSSARQTPKRQAVIVASFRRASTCKRPEVGSRPGGGTPGSTLAHAGLTSMTSGLRRPICYR
jgi:hypothetical protein